MHQEQCVEHHEHAMCHIKCLSWSAILAGALVGIGTSFLLNLFSIAIGLSLTTNSREGMATLAIGGFIGLVIGGIASMFAAGYTAGYLGRPYCMKRNLGVVYGFTAWCVALILTIMLSANMGRYITYYSSFVSHPSSAMTTTMDNKASSNITVMDDTRSNSVQVTGNNEAMAHTLGISTLLIFILFFIGALASCFGGHCGMMTCKDKENSIP